LHRATIAAAPRAALAVGLAALLGGAAGCGSDQSPEIDLMAVGSWNLDPGSADQIGYQVDVDFGWPSRTETCFPLPEDLTVTLNGREVVPEHRGDCEWDMLVRFDAVAPDAPVTVSVQSRDHRWGEATYQGLFPGSAAQLVTPAGQARAGDPIVVEIPAGTVLSSSSYGAQFYWLDTPPSQPTFYDYVGAALASDSRSVTIVAPATTGRAALVVRAVFPSDYISAQSCSGFANCLALPEMETLGPVSVEVVTAAPP
jgi:hypothetical protein